MLLHPPTDVDYLDYLNYLVALLIAALAAILSRWRPKRITVTFSVLLAGILPILAKAP